MNTAAVYRYAGFIEAGDDLPRKAALNISFFLNEICATDDEFLKKSVKWAKKQKGWNVKHFATILMRNSSIFGSTRENLNMAIALNEVEETFGHEVSSSFIEFYIRIILEKQHKRDEEDSCRKLVDMATMLSEFYHLQWIKDHDAYHKCMILSVSNNFHLKTRCDMISALIKSSCKELRSIRIDERFLFTLERFELEADIRPETFHQLHVMTVRDVKTIRNALVQIGFVTKEETKKKTIKSILSLITDYDARRLKDVVKDFGMIRMIHPEQFEFLSKHIFRLALADNHSQEKYAELVFHLMSKSFKPDVEAFIKEFRNHLSVGLSVQVSTELADEHIEEKLSHTTWIGNLYKAGVIDDDLLIDIMNTFMLADKTGKHIALCISYLMKMSGPKLSEKQPKIVDDYFEAFELKMLEENDDRYINRRNIFNDLIEHRKNGWIDHDESQKRRVKSKQKINPESRVEIPVQVEVEDEKLQEQPSAEDKEFVETLQKILQHEYLQQHEHAVPGIKQCYLTSESRCKVLIKMIFDQSEPKLRRIFADFEFIKKFLGMFKDSPIDFQKCLVDTLNLEIPQICQLKFLDHDVQIKFTRLAVISGELFKQGLLSNKKFSLILLSKHLQRLPIDALTHLSLAISPRIQLEGNKNLRLALRSLQNSILKSTKTLCATINKDLADLRLELDSLLEYKVLDFENSVKKSDFENSGFLKHRIFIVSRV